MKRLLLLTLALGLTLGLLTGCGQSVSPASHSVPAVQSAPEESSPAETQDQVAPADLPPLVMVDGQLYQDTGRESTLIGRCGVLDGEITSTVPSQEVPFEDDQSNFGTGFGYQIGAEPDTIEVYLNETWMVFEAVDEP